MRITVWCTFNPYGSHYTGCQSMLLDHLPAMWTIATLEPISTGNWCLWICGLFPTIQQIAILMVWLLLTWQALSSFKYTHIPIYVQVYIGIYTYIYAGVCLLHEIKETKYCSCNNTYTPSTCNMDLAAKLFWPNLVCASREKPEVPSGTWVYSLTSEPIHRNIQYNFWNQRVWLEYFSEYLKASCFAFFCILLEFR